MRRAPYKQGYLNSEYLRKVRNTQNNKNALWPASPGGTWQLERGFEGPEGSLPQGLSQGSFAGERTMATQTGQMPILGRWFAVSRDPHCGYKTTWSTAASTATEIELNLETVLQINCLLLQFSFVFLPRSWWLLSLVLPPVASPIFIPLYHPHLDIFFFFTSVTLWESSQAPDKTLQAPYSNDVFNP